MPWLCGLLSYAIFDFSRGLLCCLGLRSHEKSCREKLWEFVFWVEVPWMLLQCWQGKAIYKRTEKHLQVLRFIKYWRSWLIGVHQTMMILIIFRKNFYRRHKIRGKQKFMQLNSKLFKLTKLDNGPTKSTFNASSITMEQTKNIFFRVLSILLNKYNSSQFMFGFWVKKEVRSGSFQNARK